MSMLICGNVREKESRGYNILYISVNEIRVSPKSLQSDGRVKHCTPCHADLSGRNCPHLRADFSAEASCDKLTNMLDLPMC